MSYQTRFAFPIVRVCSCLTLWDPMDGSPRATLSVGFPRQAYWTRLPFPSPGDLPSPGKKSQDVSCGSRVRGRSKETQTFGCLLFLLAQFSSVVSDSL